MQPQARSLRSPLAQQRPRRPPAPHQQRTGDPGSPPAPDGARGVVATFEDDGDRGAGDADGGEDELVAEPVHQLDRGVDVLELELELAGVGCADELADLGGERRDRHDEVLGGLDQELRPVALVAQDEALEVGADDGHRVERWIELGAQAHEEQQRALEDDDLLGDMEVDAELAQRDVHLAQVGDALEAALRVELDVLQVERVERDVLLELLVEVLDDLLEHLLVGAARDEAHLLHRADDAVGVAGQRALEQLDHALADVAGDLGDGAEVEKHDGRRLAVDAGPDDQVPGVRVGVVDTVGEDLLAVDLDDLARELAAVEPELLDAEAIGDLAAGLEVGDQDARGGQLVDDPGEADVGAALEVGRDPLGVVGLGLVVELVHDDRADLAVQLGQALIGNEPADDPEDPAQGVEVAAHDLLDVGVLDLDRDLGAALQVRHVDLTDRRRGDRPVLEAGEQLVRGPVELLVDPGFDVDVGPRR